MGLGAPALVTSQKKEPNGMPGPPFDPTSANNGLSVDPISGKIVLGNDQGDVGQPALLLSNREIPSGGGTLGLLFKNNAGGQAGMYQDGAGNMGWRVDEPITGVREFAPYFASNANPMGVTDILVHNDLGHGYTFCLTGSAGTVLGVPGDSGLLYITGTGELSLKNPNGTHIGFGVQSSGAEFIRMLPAGRFLIDRFGLFNDVGGQVQVVGDILTGDDATFTQMVDINPGNQQMNFSGTNWGVNPYRIAATDGTNSFVLGADDIAGGFLEYNGAGLSIDTSGNMIFDKTIRTQAPSGGASGAWALGQFEAGAVVPTAGIRVNIGGTDYLIPAKVA